MLRNKIFSLGVSSLFLLITACGQQGTILTSDVNNLSTFVSTYQNQAPKIDDELPVEQPQAIENFINKTKKMGVSLNDEQLKLISIQRHIKPSGEFAARPAHNLTSEQNLKIHFKKHSNEFKNINTEEEYLQRAISFHLRQDKNVKYYFDVQSFAKNYQSNVVKHDAITREFSAMRADGAITTYFTNNSLSSKRFVEVPEAFYIK